MKNQLDNGPLSKWERCGLVAFLATLIGFGVLVEIRSALLELRMGDLGVYLRTAWAVRTGEDIYDVTDRGRWHYCYPSLLAILLTPLADPPEGVHAAGVVPYPVSVAVCYLLNLALLGLAVHWMAGALERSGEIPFLVGQRAGSRAWWALRIGPILVCLPSVGHTLMRGQINLLVLALVAGMIAAIQKGRPGRAGIWLSGAICFKMIPAFLLLYPLWRREGRMLAGCLVGLLIGLLVIPAAVFGPAGTIQQCRKLNEVMILPALGMGKDRSRADELINVTATDSQSVLTILHNTLHLERRTRPNQASTAVRVAAVLFCGLLTLVTLLVAGRRPLNALATLLFIGALLMNLLFLSPICHLHYYCLGIPLIMGLIARQWQQAGGPRLAWTMQLALTGFALAQVPAHIPGLEIFREGGLLLYAGLALWLVGILTLISTSPERNRRFLAPLACARA